MKSFLKTGRSGRRTDKLKQKYRSRFADGGASTGNRDLARFRRNRQLLARESTSTLLWLAITVMLIPLGRSLWHVARAHLHDRPLVWQVAFPATAALAMMFCLLRARSGWREIIELRRDRVQLLHRLRSQIRDESSPSVENGTGRQPVAREAPVSEGEKEASAPGDHNEQL